MSHLSGHHEPHLSHGRGEGWKEDGPFDGDTLVALGLINLWVFSLYFASIEWWLFVGVLTLVLILPLGLTRARVFLWGFFRTQACLVLFMFPYFLLLTFKHLIVSFAAEESLQDLASEGFKPFWRASSAMICLHLWTHLYSTGYILKQLRRVGLPEWILEFSWLMLRQVQILNQSVHTILLAQESRGVGGSWAMKLERLGSLVSLLVLRMPKKVEDLHFALEARTFGPSFMLFLNIDPEASKGGLSHHFRQRLLFLTLSILGTLIGVGFSHGFIPFASN